MKDKIINKPCLYCKDKGYFSDELSGCESYCTCDKGKCLKQAEDDINNYMDNT